MKKPKHLPARLRSMVRIVEATLGDVIREAEGPAIFDAIEEIRRSMVAFRETAGVAGRRKALREVRTRLGRLSARDRIKLARAYTLFLELVNACENAYRTHRLRSRSGATDGASPAADVIFVLTAHPTESRSPGNIRLLRRVQRMLVDWADRGRDPDPDALCYPLHMLWRLGTHPQHRPSVADEARHLYSLIADPILDELIDLARNGQRVRLRSWVGGDKDGHPGVGARETVQSLQLSRQRLLQFVRERIAARLDEDSALLDHARFRRELRRFESALNGLMRLEEGDGGRVARLRSSARRLGRMWRTRFHHPHPSLDRLEQLLALFPGLVVPLELREERGGFGPRRPIASMLARAVEIARGGRLDSYVAGVVVSMTVEAEDLLQACARVESVAGGPHLPVIPLFELPEALERAVEILDGAWRKAPFRRMARRQGRSLEIMLGYSDTAKRMGVLASRLAIGDTMQSIGAWARERDLGILFFHGAGGSIGRGGGTFADRAAGWPREFLVPHKETLQGEMVERTLATPEILRSNVQKIAAVQTRPPRFVPPGALVRRLAEASQRTFVEVAGSPELQTLLARATPYERLGTLAIGSRPPSRAGQGAGRRSRGGLDRLRAIPWVLCWTQTRYLLHAWLGAGTAWRKVRGERGVTKRLAFELRRDPLLRAYVRTLGFTMAKIAPNVWAEYAASVNSETATALVRRLERERRDALDLALSGSPDGELLYDRRWLLESIRYRAPMIHPLNLLQIDALARSKHPRAGNEELFRETITGIAAGMLTTG